MDKQTEVRIIRASEIRRDRIGLGLSPIRIVLAYTGPEHAQPLVTWIQVFRPGQAPFYGHGAYFEGTPAGIAEAHADFAERCQFHGVVEDLNFGAPSMFSEEETVIRLAR